MASSSNTEHWRTCFSFATQTYWDWRKRLKRMWPWPRLQSAPPQTHQVSLSILLHILQRLLTVSNHIQKIDLSIYFLHLPRFCNVVQTPLEKIETLKHESFRGSTLYKQQAISGDFHPLMLGNFAHRILATRRPSGRVLLQASERLEKLAWLKRRVGVMWD